MAVERKDIEIFFRIEGLEAYITDLKTLDDVLTQVNTATNKAKEATNELETSAESFDNLESKLKTAEGGVKVLAGSFEALAGAASLLGLEDNPFFKQLGENVVGVLALGRGAIDAAEGVRLLAENQKLATAAQKTFNFVANANPYVLLAGAITALAGAYLLLKNQQGELNVQNEAFLAKIKTTNEELLKTLDFERQLAIARGESSDSVALNNTEIERLNNNIFINSFRYEELTRKKSVLNEAEKAELKALTDVINTNATRIQQLKDQNVILEETEKTRKREAAAAAAAARAEKQRALEAELTLKAFAEGRDRDLESLRRKYNADVALAKGNAELLKLIEEQLQRDIEAINEKYEQKRIERYQATVKRVTDARDIIQTASTSVTDFADRSADTWAVSYKKAFDQVIEEPSKAADLLQRDVKAAIDFATNLNTIFTKDNEKRAERTFNLNKALGITSAVINTAEAITAALTDKTQPSTILRIAQAAAVAAAGAAQIATISRTKFSPGSTDTPDVPTPLPPSGVNNPGTTQLPGQTTGETPSSIQGGPIRAYVLVSDVNSAQQANSQIENLVKL